MKSAQQQRNESLRWNPERPGRCFLFQKRLLREYFRAWNRLNHQRRRIKMAFGIRKL